MHHKQWERLGRGADTTRWKHSGFRLVPLLYLRVYLVYLFRALPQQRQLDRSQAEVLPSPPGPFASRGTLPRESRKHPGRARPGESPTRGCPPAEASPVGKQRNNHVVVVAVYRNDTKGATGAVPRRGGGAAAPPTPTARPPPARAGPIRRPPRALTEKQPRRSHPSREPLASRTPLPPLPRKRCGNTGGSWGGRGRNHRACGGGSEPNHSGDEGESRRGAEPLRKGARRAVPPRGRGGIGPHRSVPAGSAGPAPAAPGCSIETGLAGVTGIPPPASASSGGESGTQRPPCCEASAGLRSRDASFRSVGRAPSLGAGSILAQPGPARAAREDTDQC